MTVDLTAVVLAGGIRRSPLSAGLDMPVLCLPVGGSTVLERWLSSLAKVDACRSVRIVLSSPRDLAPVTRLLEAVRPGHLEVEVTLEAARWRGTGGVLRDVGSLDSNADIMLIEPASRPPESLTPLIAALADAPGAVGVDIDLNPAGIFAFRRDVLASVPTVGFYDVKEQLLPTLYRDGHPARVAQVIARTDRLWDRRSYLAWTREVQDDAPCASPDASIHPAARIAGASWIGPRAVVEAGAVIRDGIVLEGARVGRDAIVARSVLGPGSRVRAATHVVDALLPVLDVDRSASRRHPALAKMGGGA